MREKRQEEMSRRLASIRRDLAARLGRISHSFLIVTIALHGAPIAVIPVLDSRTPARRDFTTFSQPSSELRERVQEIRSGNRRRER